MNRRVLRRMLTAATTLLLPVGMALAQAQTYPSRPVKMVIGLAPGGGTDVTARLIAKLLGERLNQSFVVENRPGANGQIGAQAVLAQPADGFTLLVVTSSFAISPAVEKNLPYDSKKDFAPILIYGEQPLVLLINPKVPARTPQELKQYALSNPGQLTLGASDDSTILANSMLRNGLKADVPTVQYKGSGQVMTDVLGGHIAGTITSFGAAHAHLKSGAVRGIAVTTTKRSALAPDLPTLDETIVPGYDLTSWYALLAPSATPPNVLALLNREVGAALQTREAQEAFQDLGVTIITEPLDKVRERLAQEFTKWQSIAAASPPRE
jgi:tripartite-type tricarboxylate transporter receptor subunit TctC